LQIKQEAFVEDINNLLNSGEVPNMYPRWVQNMHNAHIQTFTVEHVQTNNYACLEVEEILLFACI